MATDIVTTRTRVKAGAAYLDVTQPGWYRTLDVEHLDLADECRCVLGQLFQPVKDADYSLDSDDYDDERLPDDGYSCGINALFGKGIDPHYDDRAELQAKLYGFNVLYRDDAVRLGLHLAQLENEDDYAALQHEWERQINKRLRKAAENG